MIKKLSLVLLTAVFAFSAEAAIKSSGTGINLNTVKPTWSKDPGHYTIKKPAQEVTNSYLVNAGSATSITPAFLTGDAAFSVTADGCGSALTTANCTIDVKFNSSGKANGVYSSIMTVGDLDIPLTAAVGYDLPAYKVVDSLGQVVSEINMNTSYRLSNLERYVLVLDSNKATSSDLAISSSSAEMVNSTSLCSVASLNGTGCVVEVTMASSVAAGSYTGILSVGPLSINLVADVQSSGSRPVTSDFILRSGSGRILSGVDFANVVTGSNEKRTVFLKDANSRATLSSTQSVSSSTYYLQTGSFCSAAAINSGPGCSILLFAIGGNTEGSYPDTLLTSINSGAYPISRTVTRSVLTDSRRLVVADPISFEESRVIKLGSYPATGAQKTFSIPMRDVNKVSYFAEPITYSETYKYPAVSPGFTVSPSASCQSGASLISGNCVISIRFTSPATALGKYTDIVTVSIGGKSESFVFEVEFY